MDISLYIIGGVIAYLLVGSVVIGLMIRIDETMAEDCWVGILAWPALGLLLVTLVPVALGIELAKRI